MSKQVPTNEKSDELAIREKFKGKTGLDAGGNMVPLADLVLGKKPDEDVVAEAKRDKGVTEALKKRKADAIAFLQKHNMRFREDHSVEALESHVNAKREEMNTERTNVVAALKVAKVKFNVEGSLAELLELAGENGLLDESGNVIAPGVEENPETNDEKIKKMKRREAVLTELEDLDIEHSRDDELEVLEALLKKGPVSEENNSGSNGEGVSDSGGGASNGTIEGGLPENFESFENKEKKAFLQKELDKLGVAYKAQHGWKTLDKLWNEALNAPQTAAASL